MDGPSKVKFSEPEIIGAYSLDGNRNYRNDLSGLKYLKLPDLSELSINLKEGGYIDKNTTYDILQRIKQMTNYVMDNHQGVIKNKRVDADFVCFRGSLSMIMTTPYNKYSYWAVRAVKFKGTIYFIILTNSNFKSQANNPNDKSYQFGFKFERYLLSSDYNEDPKGKSEIVNENEEFCILMTRTIDDSIKIFFGFESDGIIGPKVNSLDDLKKSKHAEIKLRLSNGDISDRMKQKWWSQSYLAGIEEVYVGYGNKEGEVSKIEKINVIELEKSVNVNDCLAFLKKFFKYVQMNMNNVDDSTKVFCFNWNEKRKDFDCEIRNTNGTEFLPDKFVKFMNELD